MKKARSAARIAAVSILATLFCSTAALAQAEPAPRRGAGIRVGMWQVENPGALGTSYSVTPHIEGYFQRGLDERLALESTAGVWRRTARVVQEPTGNVVETRTYIIPLFTSIKLFPFTEHDDAFEPFILAGAGFAFGIDAVGENAIGGGGTSIATGFGIKGGAGIEYHVNEVFGVLAGARYQLIAYGDELGGAETYKGLGFEGGISYRFPL
jgi:hypothetical protein